VAEEMRRSDILCLPSFTEGSPNVIKEAMACGLPVVASRVGGVPDLVREGETGLLFEAGDASQLRSCLAKLVADGYLRQKMGAAAREHILVSGMTWDDTAKDFEDIFLRVL
jgi:glycosyltransferase involved in cell wall biosynthesis